MSAARAARTDQPGLASYEHRPLLNDAAARLLADRERAYPPLVERGKLAPREAEAGLRCARALVAQWRWIIDAAAPPLPPFDYATGGSFGAPSSEIAADVARAAVRAREIADRKRGDEQLALLADCYAALAWCQRGDWIVGMVDGARLITRQLRAGSPRQGRLAA